MVKRRVPEKHKTILDYLKTSETRSATLKSQQQSAESTEDGKAQPTSSGFDEVLKTLVELKKMVQSSEASLSSSSSSGSTAALKAPPQSLQTPINMPTGQILDEILYKGLMQEDVSCNAGGQCSDGRSVGEVFVDRYGFRRQRGFLNTTRLPVFLDWIVEEAVVKELFPKTYVVETSRGSLAVIPEDFLCELHTRYGVLILNYDKCKSYRPIIGGESKKRRSRGSK